MENQDYTFESLEVWKEAVEIRKMIKMIAVNFPAQEQWRLTDQIIRSSRSVTANIAEGYGRYHYADAIRFFYISRGSMYETLDHLIFANEEGYCSREELKTFRSRMFIFLKLLNGYITYVNSLKGKNNIQL